MFASIDALNHTMTGVRVQYDRVRTFFRSPLTDHSYALHAVDLEIYTLYLARLGRIAAKISAKLPELQSASVSFSAALPQLKAIRDAVEHVEDYMLDEGRQLPHTYNPRGWSATLGFGGFGVQDHVINWQDHQLSLEQSRNAAEILYADMMPTLMQKRGN